MRVFVRVNQVGWVHVWRSRGAFEAGEASEHCFNGRIDPRWRELRLPPDLQGELEAGALVELQDPGWLDEEDLSS